MTRPSLFVVFLLCGFAVVAPDSEIKRRVRCTLATQYVKEDLEDLLHGAGDANQSPEDIREKLHEIQDEANDAVTQCAGYNFGSPAVKQSRQNRAEMYGLAELIKKDCTIIPNVSHHHFHAIKDEHGAVLYTILSMPREEYERQGYEPTQQSTYYMRRNMCQALCPGTHVVTVQHPSEIETLMQIFNGYNAQVPPADPELRQYNIGFWFQPDGASKWDDGTAYNTDVWPGFPESMPELTGYSCVNFDPETGKPVIGDCALLYDVVACEQRCVSLSYLKGKTAKGPEQAGPKLATLFTDPNTLQRQTYNIRSMLHSNK
ncbi:unnamed protein product [Toxocara canis]|uniref:C-type lectin domain-containing protein n=1 Tax=Toxocara canis TaxID=6265 RepID=A0A183VC92_TOXCA|nr:unnamed protein product [Toxocara canis]